MDVFGPRVSSQHGLGSFKDSSSSVQHLTIYHNSNVLSAQIHFKYLGPAHRLRDLKSRLSSITTSKNDAHQSPTPQIKVRTDEPKTFKAATDPCGQRAAKSPNASSSTSSTIKTSQIEVWTRDKEWIEEVQMTNSAYANMWTKSQPTWDGEPKIEYYERAGEACIFRQACMDGGEKIDRVGRWQMEARM